MSGAAGRGPGEGGAPGELTHIDASGRARMVDVSAKAETRRRAVASGSIRMAPETLRRILAGDAPKGDVLGVARIAGIQGGKRAGELIPLCHVIPAVSLDVQVDPDPALPGLRVRAEATCTGQTGVEMEALVAASLALLTAYDMAKALDREMSIDAVRLELKEGGRSGSWTRSGEEPPGGGA